MFCFVTSVLGECFVMSVLGECFVTSVLGECFVLFRVFWVSVLFCYECFG